MNRSVPFLAWLLGLAGLLPFLGCGLLALGQDGDRAALALVAYGAVILAFLGGVHWGFALDEPSGRGERRRLTLGVLPSLAGWVALLLAIALNAQAGLAMLIVAFVGTIVVESRGVGAGLVSPAYIRLRYVLSAIVGVVLLLVLLLRLAGLHLQLW
ncbi:DUF3429 domain-containing protein [Acidisphaera sp. L21]|uniref:DUF3429 domain-containing protein n=1 Tax=Acidisphaera sp. L21 TaxID=1641851 RepID=UPI00131E6CC5|nr:DUF3429 domain-containing protein [Acidisphaera sp. L21]